MVHVGDNALSNAELASQAAAGADALGVMAPCISSLPMSGLWWVGSKPLPSKRRSAMYYYHSC